MFSGKQISWLKKYPSIYKYIFELLVVFIGVFAAFLLNELRAKKTEKERQEQIYMAIHEDLLRFYDAGKRENNNGFIRFFEVKKSTPDSIIENKLLPPRSKIYGDYWKIEIISSLINGGILREIDIETYKKITRFSTVHNNFLEMISDYNVFYNEHITANYHNGIDYFYYAQTRKLKDEYKFLEEVYEQLIWFSEILVNGAEKLSIEIQEKYLMQ